MVDIWPPPALGRIDLADEPAFDLGEMRVLPAERAVVVDGDRRELQPRVMQVLLALAKASPDVLSRDKLVELCWDGRIVGDDSINRCVLALRHLAREFTPQPFVIETVPRVGHRLVASETVAKVEPEFAGSRRPRIFGAVAALLAILAVTALLGRPNLWPWRPADRAATVLVSAAANDRISQELARDLAVKLGGLQPIQSSSVRLVSQTDDASAKSDLILQVGTAGDGAPVGASVALMAVRDRSVLWSKELQQPSGRLPDLKQQVAVTAANVLRCAAEGLASEEPLSDEILKLYVSACGGMANAVDDPRNTARILERVVQSSPRFVDGWAKLLFAEVAVVSGVTFVKEDAAIDSLKRHMVIARKLQPHLAEAYLAEYFLIPESDFRARGRLLDEAIGHNPEHAELRVQRSYFLQSMGRIHDALVDAHEAVKLDPLSPSVRESYIVMLGMTGHVDAARQELRVAEQIWPGAPNIENARGLFHLRWGDPREALRIFLAEETPRATAKVLVPFLRARIDPTPANIETALRHGRMVFRERPTSIQLYSQLLAEFDRNDELFEVLMNWRRMDIVTFITDSLFRPAFADFHREPRFMRVAQHLGLVNYWRTTGEWPDFCYAADLPYDCKSEAAKAAAGTA